MKEFRVWALLIICIGFSHQLFSQNFTGIIDSLKQAVNASDSDTSKAKALNLLAEEYLRKELYDSALINCEKAFLTAGKTENHRILAETYVTFGRIKYNQENFPAAMSNFHEALKIYQQAGDQKEIANVYNMIANTYHLQGDFTNALKYQYDALKIREETGDEERTAWSYNNIATIYRIHGDYDDALQNFTKSLKVLQKYDDQKNVAIAYNNIGTVYSLQGKYVDAINNYYSSLKIRETIGEIKDIIASYVNIGDSYCDLYEKDTVTKSVRVEYADKSFRDIPRVNWLDTALNLQLKAHAMNESIGNKFYSIFSVSGQGRIYYLQKNYSKSISMYTQSYAVAEEMKAVELQKEIAKYLSDNYNRLKDYKNGMDWYLKYEAHKDTLLNQLKTDDLTKTRMQYEFEKKENETKALQEKKDALAKVELDRQKKMRNFFQGAFAIILIFAVIFFYQRNKIRKEKVRSDDLLLNILPSEIASELKQTGASKSKSFDEVTVMFADFVDFTVISEKLSPEELVKEIHTCFSAFDNILQRYRVEKIKTIGDAYLCAGGLPVKDPEHASQVVLASVEIMDFIHNRKTERESRNEIPFEIRIGIHSGPVVAGIVGVKKYAYDIWGDTVNIAARMEQNSQPGKINISASTYKLVKDKFNCTYRGKIGAKNKGEIDMYFIDQNPVDGETKM